MFLLFEKVSCFILRTLISKSRKNAVVFDRAWHCSSLRLSLGISFLRTLWRQVVLVIVGLLIMVVKNGVRIATLTILGQYVDPGFLYGRLHHEGGMVFFLLGLVLLLPVLWLLKRGEKPVATPRIDGFLNSSLNFIRS